MLNAIGLHALLLVGLGRFNSGVYKAYTLFFIIGTAGAVQIPVVGWTPLRSLEQIGPLGVCLGYQVLAYCDYQRRKSQLSINEFVLFRIKTFAALVVVLIGMVVVLSPMGYFGPLSSRIRGLFVKHTKTGNPLVDSVAEHQPANSAMYASHLNMPLDYVWLGCLVCLFNRTNGSYFLALYGYIAMHFSFFWERSMQVTMRLLQLELPQNRKRWHQQLARQARQRTRERKVVSPRSLKAVRRANRIRRAE